MKLINETWQINTLVLRRIITFLSDCSVSILKMMSLYLIPAFVIVWHFSSFMNT